MYVGYDDRGSQGGGTNNSNFFMGSGTLDATAISVGRDATGDSSTTVNGVFTVNGGTVKVATLTLADRVGSDTLTGTFNFGAAGGSNTGSILAAGTIRAGAGTLTAHLQLERRDGHHLRRRHRFDDRGRGDLETCRQRNSRAHDRRRPHRDRLGHPCRRQQRRLADNQRPGNRAAQRPQHLLGSDRRRRRPAQRGDSGRRQHGQQPRQGLPGRFARRSDLRRQHAAIHGHDRRCKHQSAVHHGRCRRERPDARLVKSPWPPTR